MGGHLSKEEIDDPSYSDELTDTFIDQLVKSTEIVESNTEAEPDPIQSKKLKPIKNCEFFKIWMESQKICINIAKIGNKIHEEEKAKRRIERDDLNNYIETIAKELTTLLENLDDISKRLEDLSNEVDKKLKSAERWGKILGYMLDVVYAVLVATVYTILVISTMGFIVLPGLDVAISLALEAFWNPIRRRFKLSEEKKVAELAILQKAIITVTSNLDGIEDSINEFLKANADDQELCDKLEKIKCLLQQVEEFESKKKQFQTVYTV